MEITLSPGVKGYQEQIVTPDLTASRYGSGLVEVFATPAMIALMEKTCQHSVQANLPDGYITVGTEVSIKHMKATALEQKVWCVSTLTVVEGRTLTFSVEAWDPEDKIGAGTHQRVIVHKDRFMSRLLQRDLLA